MGKKKLETFREWRKRVGLSVEAFALSVGMHVSTASKYDVYPERRPRELQAKVIKRKYADCPLVA